MSGSLIDSLIKYAIIVAIVGAVTAAVIGAWQHYIAEPYRIQGDVRTETRLQPQINSLSKQLADALNVNTELQGQFAGLQKSFADYAQAGIDAQIASKKAIADEKARADANAAEMLAYEAILSGPKSTDTPEVVCAGAASILDDVIRGLQ
jgi:hypothetical protein